MRSETTQREARGEITAREQQAHNEQVAAEQVELARLRTAHQALYEALSAIAEALDVPRNRFGKLESDPAKNEELRKLAVLYKVGASEDVAHQAVQVAKAALADAAQGEK